MPMVKTSRRNVLRALAGSTVAASTMRFFLRTAESATFPTRFLFVYTNAGRDSESRSTGTGAAFTLGPGMAALEPYKSKILILDGLKIPAHTGEEHPCGKSALLTARPAANGSWAGTGISFDRYLAHKLTQGASFYTGTAVHATGSGDIDQPVSWDAGNTPNRGYALGSTALMSKLFGAGTGTTSGPAPSSPSAPSARDQNEAALYDHLMGEVKSLQRVAPKDQLQKLELHVQALQQIRSGLLPATGSVGGETPMVTKSCGNSVDLRAASAETDKVSLTIAHAFACGRARVGVMRIGSEDPYHNYSHWRDGSDLRGKMRQVDKEWAGSFARLLGYLDSLPEGTGTVLDNTVVVWGSDCCGEFGVGVDYGPKDDGNGIHGTEAMPFVLAGKLGGKLKTGHRIIAPGRTSLDLYRAIANAMGVNASDFGAANFTTGPLQEILT